MSRIITPFAVGLIAAAGLTNIVAAQELSEVTVRASLQTHKRLIGYNYGGVPVDNVSLSLAVSTSGLDLVSNAGVMELQKRVNVAAERACKELGSQFPDSTTTDEECIRQTVDKAAAEVNKVVAAAAEGAGK